MLSHVEGLWGPDVGGLAVLGCVHDLTVQYSILGEGLLRSRHPGSSASNGHAMALNIADNYGNPANRVTVYGNLLTTAAERNPRLVGATCTDLIDNVFYNYSEGPSGNPSSANLIGNTYQRGPAPAAAGLSFSPLEWRYAKDIDFFSTLSRTRPGPPATGRWASASPPPAGTTPSCAAPARPARRRSPARARPPPTPACSAWPGLPSAATRPRACWPTWPTARARYYSGQRGPEPRPSWP